MTPQTTPAGESAGAVPTAAGTARGDAARASEGRLLRAVEAYLGREDAGHVRTVLAYARELEPTLRDAPHPPLAGAQAETPVARGPVWDVSYVLDVAETLADAIHIDAISLGAVLLYQPVERGLVSLDDIRARLGGEYGDAVAQTIESIERFDTLQRPGEALRRSAQAAQAEGGETRRRPRPHLRQQDAESLRKMFVGMAEDPRVAIFKIADQLRKMRAVREAADAWRAHAARGDGQTDGRDGAAFEPPPWTAEECRRIAQETRDIYAPLAGRLGMGRVEGQLDDLAFAVLEPDDYAWLERAVRAYTQERGSYVDRVVGVLRAEMGKIGLRAEVSGRVKHLYSIYKKVKRSGDRDLTNLYDILAFRIVVPTVADCYLALGHVHALWPPKDGRIKDFIATPKPNGYRSLHTTVFCLDGRLAEIQIRTPEMHQEAEYGVAMHWYYKDVGDNASARAAALQKWVQQVKEWQEELTLTRPGAADRAMELVKNEALREQIFVFTPAGDVKELPAGATPLDFAYMIHSEVGNHVAGVRVSSADAGGKLTRRLVPLDYELKSGDVVEIIKRKDAHPTRDWLNVVRTKGARDKIHKYLKEHERDIDMQLGRDRLDRELKGLGLRKGLEEVGDDDLEWMAEALGQKSVDDLLAGIGNDKIRPSALVAKLRERLLPAPAAPTEEEEASAAPETPTSPRQAAVRASVAGMAGMLTNLANCCNPLPGDQLMGFVTRGRGVVIHRADCPNLRHLLDLEPERGVAVDWPEELTGQQSFRAPLIVEAVDRQGLLADVTGVITGQKINMLSVSTVTNQKLHRALITATLEITRPDQISAVMRALQQVPSVLSVERKQPKSSGTGAHRPRR